MATAPDTVEAYKSIIDFNKVIVSISSTILTAVIAYLALQGGEYEVKSYTCLALLVLSIMSSLGSFGIAIKTIKDGVSRSRAIFMANGGAIILILGIFMILLIKPIKEQTIDSVLKVVEKSTKTMKKNLNSENCTSIELNKDRYILHYLNDTVPTMVVYSLDQSKIIQIK